MTCLFVYAMKIIRNASRDPDMSFTNLVIHPAMKVTVNFVNGKNLSFEIEPADTVKKLKKKHRKVYKCMNNVVCSTT